MGTTAIEELLKACTPATFGKKGKEVLDESYRKAVKLDSNEFSTSFNPYEVGIIDAIAQSLLPGIAKPFSDRESKHEENLGVIAELYKLNVSIDLVNLAVEGHLRPDMSRGGFTIESLFSCCRPNFLSLSLEILGISLNTSL